MSCNFDKLKKLLRDNGYTEAAEHAESARWKLVQAKYYEKLAKENDLSEFLARYQGSELKGNNPQLKDSLLQCEAHTMCLAQSLHSVADILAQVVNDLVLKDLNSQMSNADVTFGKVTKSLDDEGSADSIAVSNVMKSMKQSPEFEYINAFVNTIKHRSLVKSQMAGHYDVSGEVQEGLRFQEFEYNGVQHPETFASAVYEAALDEIEKNVCQLVDKLIEILERP